MEENKKGENNDNHGKEFKNSSSRNYDLFGSNLNDLKENFDEIKKKKAKELEPCSKCNISK